MQQPNQFQQILAVLNWLRSTATSRRVNHIQADQGVDQILKLTREWQDDDCVKQQLKFAHKRPYTHQFRLEPIDVKDIAEYIKTIKRSVHVCIFIIVKAQDSWEEIDLTVNEVMGCVEHRIVAQTPGAKLVRTIGRVGKMRRGQQRNMGYFEPDIED